jgi:GntR family transcriptional regulator
MPSESGPQPVLPRQIEDELRARIASGLLRPGTTLPSEASLSAEFGVPRGTVRRALAALRDDGLVAGGPGRRAVVRSGARSRPIASGVPFREWALGLGLDPAQRTLEVARREGRAEACWALRLPDGSPVVDILRLGLLGGRPAMVERSSFVPDIGLLLLDHDADSCAVDAFLRERGVRLGRTRHVLDAVAASTPDAQLLGVPSGSPLLRERRTVFEASGRPVGYSDDRCLPHLANVCVETVAAP